MSGTQAIYLLAFIVTLVLSAFFSSSEIAFINLQRVRLRYLKETGVPGADRVARILERPERFLSVVLTSISFTETVLVTTGSLLVVSFLGESLGTPVGIVAVAMVLLLFVKVIPKTLAARHAERLALAYATPIEVTSKIVSPVVAVLSLLIDRITRPVGGDTLKGTLLGKDELHMLISLGEESGAVDGRSASMLRRVVRFGDREVHEVMTPRTQVVWLRAGLTLADFQAIYVETPALRYPVYEENFDNVRGMISARDVHVGLAQGALLADSDLSSFIRPVYFVPRRKLVGHLFTEMQSKGFALAVVVSEYGGTSGTVSIEQLVEEIVGEVRDELAAPGERYRQVSEHAYQLDGAVPLAEANSKLGLDLPPGNYETIAGFALDVFGHVPEQGEVVRCQGWEVTAIEVSGQRIARVLVSREEIVEGDDAPSGGDSVPGKGGGKRRGVITD